MPDFDIDRLKESWQQDMPKQYDAAQIRAMLQHSSRNYIKFIFWISLAEFAFFSLLNFYYFFSGTDVVDFMHITQKLGIDQLPADSRLEGNVYFMLKCASILVTAYFVIRFYQKYRAISVEANLKALMEQLIDFKKTVKYFILANIFLLVGSIVVIGALVLWLFQKQGISLNRPEVLSFAAAILLAMLLGVGFIWLYYRLAYGILMQRLSRNMEQLKRLEEE